MKKADRTAARRRAVSDASSRERGRWSALSSAQRLRLMRLGAILRRARLTASLAIKDTGPRIRRALDILVSGVALLLIAPVLLFAALAIKLTSRGPIFYRQERIGEGGRPFTLLKLRTMVQNADALKSALAEKVAGASDGIRFKIKRDPRLTPVGGIFRKFSVDELPQLWNVFVGDMTLVGPRPPVRREVVLYDPRALRRLEVRPGLTCLWQIGGRSELSFEQQVELDLDYIDRIRPGEEIAIVIKTVPAVLSGRGAY